MAVRAQRRHVPRMVFPTERQILDVVDVKDRLTTPVALGWHPGTAGALAASPAPQQHRPPRRRTSGVVRANDPSGLSLRTAPFHAIDQLGVRSVWSSLGDVWVVLDVVRGVVQ